jgi:hypothetical protein
MRNILTDSQAQRVQHLVPKVYTYRMKIPSATKALTMRVDQFGNISRLRTLAIKPSELTGWMVTHSDLPIADARTASAVKDLPENANQAAEKTSATPTSPSTTVTRQVHSVERPKDPGNASATPTSSSNVILTLRPKTRSVECLKVVNNTIRKPSGIEEEFELVSKTELDDEEFDVVNDEEFDVADDEDFDVVDNECPSTANGAIKDKI